MRDWLIKARKERGLTQEQVSSQCFIDRSYYAQIEIGTRNPSMEVAKQISTALGVSPSTFFTDRYDEPSFLSLFKNSQMIIAYCNLNLEYIWIFNPNCEADTDELLGKRDDELDHKYSSLELLTFKQEVIDTGRKMRRKIVFAQPKGISTFDIYAEPIFDKAGKILGVITISIDITKGNRKNSHLKENMKE